MYLFFSAVLMGFSIAIPIGPVDLLCIRNSIVWGCKWGLLTGLGIATADVLIGIISGFGIRGIQTFLTAHDHLVYLIGNLFLCMIGMFYITKKQFSEKDLPNSSSTYLMGFLMAAFSPVTLFTFLVFFGISGIVLKTVDQAILAGLGIFLGSTLWWTILSFGAVFFRSWFDQKGLTWLTRGLGFIFLTVGLVNIFS